jgi:pilus assembly protein Flp/PilA
MVQSLKKLIRDERGATAVEYGLIIAGIAAVIITIVMTLGGKIQAAFQTVNDEMPASN